MWVSLFVFMLLLLAVGDVVVNSVDAVVDVGFVVVVIDFAFG